MGHGLLLPIILPLRRFEIGELIRLGSRLRVFFGCLGQSKSAASNIFSYFVSFGYTGERLIPGLRPKDWI